MAGLSEEWKNFDDICNDLSAMSDFSDDLTIEVNHMFLNECDSSDSETDTFTAPADLCPVDQLPIEPPTQSNAASIDKIMKEITASMKQARIVFEDDSLRQGPPSSLSSEDNAFRLAPPPRSSSEEEAYLSAPSPSTSSEDDAIYLALPLSTSSEDDISRLAPPHSSPVAQQHLKKKKKFLPFKPLNEPRGGFSPFREEWKPMKAEGQYSLQQNEFPNLRR